VRTGALLSMLGLLALGAAACGSSGKGHGAHAAAPNPLPAIRICLRRHGYTISPESQKAIKTAPDRFELYEIWNLVHPDPAGVSLALAYSRSNAGAAKAAVWLRAYNKKLGKGVVEAPVVRFGRVDVLWTAKPSARDKSGVYGCVQAQDSVG